MLWTLFIFSLFAPSLAQYVGILFQHYGVGLAARILVHVVMPIVAVVIIERKKILPPFLHPFSNATAATRTWSVKIGLITGFVAMVIILGFFILLWNVLNWNEILGSLLHDFRIRREVFPWIALAVVVVNPFIEEYFWRGFVYGFFSEKASSPLAKKIVFYTSGIFFALHHVVIVRHWFNWWEFLLSVGFLMITGLLFNWMYDRSRSILASWITHTLADIALVGIGLYLFGFI